MCEGAYTVTGWRRGTETLSCPNFPAWPFPDGLFSNLPTRCLHSYQNLEWSRGENSPTYPFLFLLLQTICLSPPSICKGCFCPSPPLSLLGTIAVGL